MPLINIPDSLKTRDSEAITQTRWQARIPTEGRYVKDVIEDVNRRLRELSDDEPMHYYRFATYHHTVEHNPRWPYAAWIGCFPVRGSNEGYFVHVHAILRDGTNQLLAICKIEDEDRAIELAAIAFYLLEA